MDLTQLRHAAEKAELNAQENYRLAQNDEIRANQDQQSNPSSAELHMNSALRYRQLAKAEEEEAQRLRQEMEQKQQQLDQLREEKLRVQAECEAKIIELDSQIKNLEGSVF